MTLHRTFRAQAMVEFALALPIFLLVIYGIMEASRAIFIYSQVVTASREGARYASAWGVSGVVNYQYQDCTGIRNAAKNVAVILPLSTTNNTNIKIYYTKNSTPTGSGEYCTSSGLDTSHTLGTGDSVSVTVSAPYSPIVPLVPFTSYTITATSSRTLLGLIELNPTATPSS